MESDNMSMNLDSVPIDGLSAPQISALACLADGRTIAEVAHDLNISRQTIYNWQKEPKFAAALNATRQVFADELRDYMLTLSRKALKRLEAIIDDPKSSPSVALKASLAVLNRPQFPEQGWNLPANINTPRQERIQETNLAIEIEMKQAELENSQRKLMMAKIKAQAQASAPVGQNLTPKQPVQPVNPNPKITPISPPLHPTAAAATQ
jgi:DNA-binding XRE family transcriptional regulator